MITQDVLICFNSKGEADRKVIVNTYHVFAADTWNNEYVWTDESPFRQMLNRWRRLHFSVSLVTHIVEGMFDVTALACTYSEQYLSHR